MDSLHQGQKKLESPFIEEQNSSMNNVHQIVAFATAARNGSFAKAARELSQTPSTVAKSIGRLERQLGVKLFYRTTRHVGLTPDGHRLFDQCQRILDEVELLKTFAAGARGQPSGTLRIEVPITYGKRVVIPVLARLLDRHPQLRIDARFSDAYSDVIREGLDAVIRIGPLSDSRLVAKLVGQQRLLTCASPAYLARHGMPRTPYELEGHECVIFRVPTSGRDRPWQFRLDGVEVEIHPDARLRLGDGEALVEAATAGLGLVQVPDYMTIESINSGRLVEVLASHRPAPMSINVVYPTTRMVPPRVRALIEALSQPGATKLRIRLS
jgi:LysR family transcriptional regulator for bpeEF and oprC